MAAIIMQVPLLSFHNFLFQRTHTIKINSQVTKQTKITRIESGTIHHRLHTLATNAKRQARGMMQYAKEEMI